MVQLWVNLPASVKMSPPRYQELTSAKIPTVELPGWSLRVIAGNYGGTSGPAQTFSPINAWDIQVKEAVNFELDLPDGHTSLVIVQSGEVHINQTPVKAVEVAVLDRSGTKIKVQSNSPARLLVLTGEPIGEPVVGHGPFVMNTRDEIQQAIVDFRSGKMGQLISSRIRDSHSSDRSRSLLLQQRPGFFSSTASTTSMNLPVFGLHLDLAHLPSKDSH